MITQQKRPASTELHHVAAKVTHQAWHVEVQQQADMDPAHAQERSEIHRIDWQDW